MRNITGLGFVSLIVIATAVGCAESATSPAIETSVAPETPVDSSIVRETEAEENKSDAVADAVETPKEDAAPAPEAAAEQAEEPSEDETYENIAEFSPGGYYGERIMKGPKDEIKANPSDQFYLKY